MWIFQKKYVHIEGHFNSKEFKKYVEFKNKRRLDKCNMMAANNFNYIDIKQVNPFKYLDGVWVSTFDDLKAIQNHYVRQGQSG